MTDWVTDDDWDRVWAHVCDAADEIAVEGSTQTALMALTGERNIPLVATKFHDAIVARLANDPSLGARRDPSDPDRYDLVLFGHRGEIKTGITEELTSNRSYSDKEGGPARLVVFVNYTFAPIRYGMEEEPREFGVFPYLMRYGFVTPDDYVSSSSGQRSHLHPSTVRRLSAPWRFTDSGAYLIFPAILAVPGVGRATIEKLGLDGQSSVTEYLRTSGDSRYYGLEAIADKFDWGTAGCRPEDIAWGDL